MGSADREGLVGVFSPAVHGKHSPNKLQVYANNRVRIMQLYLDQKVN